MKNRRALVYALVAASVAFALQYAYIRKYEFNIAAAYEPMNVLVARRNIPAGVLLDDSMVRPTTIPRQYLTKSAVDNPDFLFGQMSAVPILEDEQVTQTKLLSIEEAGLARKIPAGYRAVSIGVTRVSGVSNQIRPGNRIDIVGIFDFGTKTGVDMQSTTLFQDVTVLSVGDELSQATPKMKENVHGLFDALSDPTEYSLAEETPSYTDITVALRPEEAQRLLLAQDIGDLRVTLRRTNTLGEDKKAIPPSSPCRDFSICKQVIPAKKDDIIRIGPYLPSPWKK